MGRFGEVIGLPFAMEGTASAWFVVTANAWMNQPTGFALDPAGNLVDPNPWAAMLNDATPVQTTHMILAAPPSCWRGSACPPSMPPAQWAA